MKKRNLIFSLVAMLLMGSCSEVSDVQQLRNADGRVNLTVSDGTPSKAMRAADGLYTSRTGFDGGETVKVYMQSGSSTTSTDYSVGVPYGNAGLKMSDLTAVSSDDALRYPNAAMSSVNLFGVYPSTSTAAHTVSYDQTGDAAYKASDLMYATIPVSWNNFGELYSMKPNLPFQHQLVKLVVKIVKYPDVWQLQEVKLHNVKRSVGVTDVTSDAMTLDAATTATDGDGDEILIAGEEPASTMAETKEYTYVCVFPAQTWDDGNGAAVDFLTVQSDTKTTTYKLLKTFSAGGEYQLTIHLNGNAVGSELTIEGWDDDTEKVINPITMTGGALQIDAIGDELYDGTAHRPAVRVTSMLDGTLTTLVEGTDYDEVMFFNNTKAGTANVLVTGKAGTAYDNLIGLATFKINPRPLTLTAKDGQIQKDDEDTYGTTTSGKTFTNLTSSTYTNYVTGSTGTDEGLVSGHYVYEVKVTPDNTSVGSTDSKLTPSAAVIWDSNSQDVTSSYDISYADGTLTVINHKKGDVESATVGNLKCAKIYTSATSGYYVACSDYNNGTTYALSDILNLTVVQDGQTFTAGTFDDPSSVKDDNWGDWTEVLLLFDSSNTTYKCSILNTKLSGVDGWVNMTANYIVMMATDGYFGIFSPTSRAYTSNNTSYKGKVRLISAFTE